MFCVGQVMDCMSEIHLKAIRMAKNKNYFIHKHKNTKIKEYQPKSRIYDNASKSTLSKNFVN